MERETHTHTEKQTKTRTGTDTHVHMHTKRHTQKETIIEKWSQRGQGESEPQRLAEMYEERKKKTLQNRQRDMKTEAETR